jgi:galactonate dehydratase
MTKIAGADIYIVRIGGRHPVIVQLKTDSGVTGVGEAALAYGIGETAAAGMIKDLVENIVLGWDPFRIEALWSEMYDHTFWAKGGGPIVFGGISAIEQALWDIKGKMLGVPVYELLGVNAAIAFARMQTAGRFARIRRMNSRTRPNRW